MLGGDDFSVDDDIELSLPAGDDRGIDVQLALELGGQTGRSVFVASGAAVQDLDVAHGSRC